MAFLPYLASLLRPPLALLSSLSCLCPIFADWLKLAEVGTFVKSPYAKRGRKILKIHFLKNLSFELKNNIMVVYSYTVSASIQPRGFIFQNGFLTPNYHIKSA